MKICGITCVKRLLHKYQILIETINQLITTRLVCFGNKPIIINHEEMFKITVLRSFSTSFQTVVILSVFLIKSRLSKELFRSDKIISSFLKVLSDILSGYKSETAWQICNKSFLTSPYVPYTVGLKIFLISDCRICSDLIFSIIPRSLENAGSYACKWSIDR